MFVYSEVVFYRARLRVLRVETLVVGFVLIVWCAVLVILLHTTHYKNKTVKSVFSVCRHVWVSHIFKITSDFKNLLVCVCVRLQTAGVLYVDPDAGS